MRMYQIENILNEENLISQQLILPNKPIRNPLTKLQEEGNNGKVSLLHSHSPHS
jgi:hypothetical protein